MRDQQYGCGHQRGQAQTARGDPRSPEPDALAPPEDRGQWNGVRRQGGPLGHSVRTGTAAARPHQEAVQVGVRVSCPADPPPGNVRPGQGDLSDVLGGAAVSGQAKSPFDQSRPPRFREGAEILAAAADDVRDGELVARIEHYRLHMT
jgi:hypothetical protein